MRIYLDDCADSDLLARFLREAGHIVQNPRVANRIGVEDHEHLEYAAQNGYALLTFNPDDFRELHVQWQRRGHAHAGIFLVYRDNDVTRDMRYSDMVEAISHLIASGLPIANQVHTLNQWR